MKTPEGYVKADIQRWLDRLPNTYTFNPVQGGYGKQTVDKLCCINGRFVAIEAKRFGLKPTERQTAILRLIEECGGVAVWADSVTMLEDKLRGAGVIK